MKYTHSNNMTMTTTSKVYSLVSFLFKFKLRKLLKSPTHRYSLAQSLFFHFCAALENNFFMRIPRISCEHAKLVSNLIKHMDLKIFGFSCENISKCRNRTYLISKSTKPMCNIPSSLLSLWVFKNLLFQSSRERERHRIEIERIMKLE